MATYSQATLAKLASQTYTYGTLRQGGDGRAPDGGAIADYPKGWRFLPTPTPEQEAYYQYYWSQNDPEFLSRFPTITDRMKSFGQVVNAMDRLHNLGGVRDDASGTSEGFKAIIERHFQAVAVEPLIKFHAEEKAKEKEEERQTIATLKMRVQELEKKPIDIPTAPAITTSPTSYLPLAVVGIVIVVILLFLRRRP